MNKDYDKSLFIFRRDLRLFDNSGLIKALETSQEVSTVFVFDTRILERRKENNNIVQFMINSLVDLKCQLEINKGRLVIFRGKSEEIVKKIINNHKIEAVFLNKDYTPFSLRRDKMIAELCKKKGVAFHLSHDYLLNEPEVVQTAKNEPYVVFTPYYRKASQINVERPKQNKFTNYSKEELENEEDIEILDSILKGKNSEIAVRGGTDYCSAILRNLKKYRNYEYERDFPILNKTTHLSAYLKFGTCSVREVYHQIITQLGSDHPLIRQLYWRDFFTQVGYFFPRVYRKSFRKKYDKIKWIENEKIFQAWCDGKTGFPIVDAGMRELNKTGYMHNRVRMIVASFLTKDLH
ncbi:MAG: cryptochrome/photolyase family protein, partial [Candidatus Heimdallarchaeaceae archaeon]